MIKLHAHPWDSTPIDAIERRIAHLRGVFGVLGTAAQSPEADEMPLSREDLVNLTWLAQDYLVEIGEWAQRLDRAAKKEPPACSRRVAASLHVLKVAPKQEPQA